MVGIPLPPITPNPYKQLQGVVEQAYSICLELESGNDASQRADADHFPLFTVETSARLLGYLLLVLPPGVDADLAQKIIRCSSRRKRVETGIFYLEHFIMSFRRQTPTANPSEHSSCPSFEEFEEELKSYEQALRRGEDDHRALKALALKRDNYRCLVTGMIDRTSLTTGRAPDDGTSDLRNTELCHIIPKGLYDNFLSDRSLRIGSQENPEGMGEQAARDAAGLAAVLARFSTPNLPIDLSGPGINSLKNALTLCPDMHSSFDRLQIWFEETHIPHSYRLGRVHPRAFPGIVEPFTFTTTDPRYDLPDPDYIRLHAICARVAHLSGAGEVIDRAFDDFEFVSPPRNIVCGQHELSYLDLRLCGLANG